MEKDLENVLLEKEFQASQGYDLLVSKNLGLGNGVPLFSFVILHLPSLA